jgi:hypothetical protein
MHKEPKEVKHFWQEYRAAVSSQGVPDSKVDWFVRWAQRFARAMPSIPLRARTKAHVRVFATSHNRSTWNHGRPSRHRKPCGCCIRNASRCRGPGPGPSKPMPWGRPGQGRREDPFATRLAQARSMRHTRRC